LGFAEGDFPQAEAYGRNAISLPLYPGLQGQDQQRVVEVLADLLG
jgi:dTDP-4-amino-4,6-dideoxygalactose transaminase